MRILFALVLSFSACAFAQNYVGADGPTYQVDMQKSRAEYRTGLIVPKDWESRKIQSDLPKLRADLPAKFSWQNRATPIRNQGNCGSCWAFSAQATLADSLALHGKGSLDLSEQWIVSCDSESEGCSGGWYHTAFSFVKRLNGNVLEASFPYKAADVACKSGLTLTHGLVSYKELSSGVASPDVIKQAIYLYGPISVAVSVSDDFANYRSGIYNNSRRGPINHAVNIVGWDETVKPAHWIMRNSWGESWGERGYMRIAYGAKSIGYAATYVDTFGPVPHADPTPDPTPTPPGPTPPPGPCPDPVPCQPCTFFRWLATLFGV